MKFSDLRECPFCGFDEYYTKDYLCGPSFYNERFDGDEADNEDLYNNLMTYSHSGRAYCKSCRKFLGNKIYNIVGKNAEKEIRKDKQNNESKTRT